MGTSSEWVCKFAIKSANKINEGGPTFNRGLIFKNGLIFQEWAYFKGDRGPIFKGDQELFSRLGLFWQAGQGQYELFITPARQW